MRNAFFGKGLTPLAVRICFCFLKKLITYTVG
jgi:hypothetical protein